MIPGQAPALSQPFSDHRGAAVRYFHAAQISRLLVARDKERHSIHHQATGFFELRGPGRIRYRFSATTPFDAEDDARLIGRVKLAAFIHGKIRETGWRLVE